MESLSPEIIGHMVEASDPTRYSVLLRNTAELAEFLQWCKRSVAASRIIQDAKDEIHMFATEPGASTYCIAISAETLARIMRSLAREYEDLRLAELFGQRWE
jgi:hypothetical protein